LGTADLKLSGFFIAEWLRAFNLLMHIVNHLKDSAAFTPKLISLQRFFFWEHVLGLMFYGT
jgi:hypothetical protein